MELVKLSESEIDLVCKNLSKANSWTHRVSFNKFVAKRGPMIRTTNKNLEEIEKTSIFSRKSKINRFSFPTWYFRYIQNHEGEFILPEAIRTKSIISTEWGDNEIYLFRNRFRDFKVELDEENLYLNLNCIGNMRFTNLRFENENPARRYNADGLLEGTSRLVLPRKDVKLDLLVFGDYMQTHGCFITTACTQSQGLSDNCVELRTLRSLRDDYILNSEEGTELVKDYYSTSPKIVSGISSNPESKRILEQTYQDISKAVRLTLNGDNGRAVRHYEKMVQKLKKDF